MMADTMNYMLAGYGGIFGVLILYALSLIIRSGRFAEQMAKLEDEPIAEQLKES